jgi:hypothetical protein
VAASGWWCRPAGSGPTCPRQRVRRQRSPARGCHLDSHPAHRPICRCGRPVGASRWSAYSDLRSSSPPVIWSVTGSRAQPLSGCSDDGL